MCVTQGDLYLRALILSMYAILKAGHAFSFVRGDKVLQIYGSSSGPWMLTSLYREEACKSQRSAGVFFLVGADWATSCACCII